MNSRIPFYVLALLAFLSLGLIGCATVPASVNTIYVTISGKHARVINKEFYGNNYWCWDSYTDTIHGTEEQGKALHLGLLRAGGYNTDAQKAYAFDPFNYAQIDEYVAYCRAIGAEPYIQVPILKNIDNKKATASDAEDLVRYCNTQRKYGVKYWSIGNEPDQYEGKDLPKYGVKDYCKDFKAYSAAMKSADNSIKVMGPEITKNHYYPCDKINDWLTPFLIECKGYYDIVAIHRYPFESDGCTISSATRDNQAYLKIIEAIKDKMDSLGLGSIPLAVTEANITWNGNNDDNYYAASPQKYYAALWTADQIGASLESGLWSLCFWSLAEGNCLSFLDPHSKTPRPSYFAQQIFSTHMSDVCFPQGISGSSYSIYCGYNKELGKISIIIINKRDSLLRLDLSFDSLPFEIPDTEVAVAAYSIYCVEIDRNQNKRVLAYTPQNAARGFIQQ
jgi:hypothetical protein